MGKVSLCEERRARKVTKGMWHPHRHSPNTARSNRPSEEFDRICQCISNAQGNKMDHWTEGREANQTPRLCIHLHATLTCECVSMCLSV